MANVKFILLIPLTYNDGSEVPEGVLAAIKDELFVLAGGYTVNGTVDGAYQMSDGTRQVEKLLQLSVVIAEEHQEELRAMVGRFGQQLGQESMYLEQSNSVVEFVPPSS